MRRPSLPVSCLAAAALALSLLPATAHAGRPAAPRVSPAASPAESSTFSTVAMPQSSTLQSASDGDLWPSCWSDDGNLYAANGDGKGFSLGGASSDIAVSRIAGGPGSLSGSTIASGNGVGQVWSGSGYTRKPTGMVCMGNTMYLAVQDLNTNFTAAPAATIAKSTDHGQTWTWNRSAPMFSNSVFTTIFFVDNGKAGANAADGYVYAYGLDRNWRFTGNPANDPLDLWLARVPKASVQDRSQWQFFTGTSGGTATWSADINSRVAVIHDDRRVYTNPMVNTGANNMSVLSQGGVTYDKPLGRYLYTSWTEYTYEFYESTTPYGPWTHFLSKDFGGYPWTQTKNGGYATTLPSKFMSADGKSLYLQSNVCPCGGGGTSVYNYALRPVRLTVGPTAAPTNPINGTANLARVAGTVPVERVAHFGNDGFWNDGNRANTEDDWNNEHKTASWWGYTWPAKYRLNKVVYTTGRMYSDGGWFAGNLRVQVRNGSTWTDVTSTVSPAYPYSSAAGNNATYTFTFPATAGDGVRIYGAPGGTVNFTSIGELEAYYA